MSGQPIASDRFFLFNTILVLTNLVVQSMGLLIGAASPSLEASTFIGPICAIPVLIFAGFFIKKDDMMKAEIQIVHLKQNYILITCPTSNEWNEIFD